VFFSQHERPSFAPSKVTGKILVLYILIFLFTDNKQDGKRFWTEWQQTFLEYIALVISLCMKCWLVISFPIIWIVQHVQTIY
jgi:hypothetical protein